MSCPKEKYIEKVLIDAMKAAVRIINVELEDIEPVGYFVSLSYNPVEVLPDTWVHATSSQVTGLFQPRHIELMQRDLDKLKEQFYGEKKKQ
jgi:hypothetical protein